MIPIKTYQVENFLDKLDTKDHIEASYNGFTLNIDPDAISENDKEKILKDLNEAISSMK